MAQRRITDEGLVCFVMWCRQNPTHIVTNPDVARKVLAAYTKVRPTVMQGVVHGDVYLSSEAQP